VKEEQVIGLKDGEFCFRQAHFLGCPSDDIQGPVDCIGLKLRTEILRLGNKFGSHQQKDDTQSCVCR